MFNPLPAIGLAITIAALSPAAAFAQSLRASEAPPAYTSAMEGYQPFTQQDVAPWKQSNDTVREIGGWRAYAREARPPAASASAASRPSPAASAPASAPRADAKP